MIDFPCTYCGEPLSVPSDLSGGDVQCPVCHRLASVPLLSDLPNLRRDGTLGMAPVLEREEPDRLEALARSFGKSRVDDDGEEIDNRTLPDLIELAPLPPPPRRPTPRYDPETGERIDAIDLKKEAPVRAIPLGPGARAGPPPVNYATPGKTERVAAASVWMELFTPGNAVVLLIVGIAHVVGALIDFFVRGMIAIVVMLGAPYIPAWPFNIFFWLAVAHYANVIYETGEEERDEIPRPLRNGSFVEDLFMPVLRAGVACAVAYLPLIAASAAGEPSPLLVAAGMVVGGFLFPATFLSACGSNSLANLRPDRVFRVIRAGGFRYLVLALITIPVVPLYLWIALGVNYIEPLLGGTPAGDWLATQMSRGILMLPLLSVCVYAAHGVCWRLGQLLRQHHGEFRWAWEVHEAERLAERQRKQAERAARARAAGRPGVQR